MCDELVKVIKSEKPDFVISVGDYWEPIYDTTFPDTELANLTDVFLNGNHDRDYGVDRHSVDGILFIHGHQKEILPSSRVSGHTHEPCNNGFMDIGSLTITRTYALCEDGVCELRRI